MKLRRMTALFLALTMLILGASGAMAATGETSKSGVAAALKNFSPTYEEPMSGLFIESLFKAGSQLSVAADNEANEKYLKQLSPKASSKDKMGKAYKSPNHMECVDGEGAKYTYTFFENGVGYSYSPASAQAGETLYFTVDKAVYQKLYSAQSKRLDSTSFRTPSWLSIMRYSKCEEIFMTDGVNSKTSTSSDSSFIWTFREFQHIVVSFDKEPSRFSPDKLPNTKHKVNIKFKNDIVYKLRTDGKMLFITSSDMDYGLSYTLMPGSLILDTIKNLSDASIRINPPTAKPVIYLYPETPTEVSVKLDYNNGEFTFTEPVYDNGWRVLAEPDGTLTNLLDGKTYPYLFWEGDKKIDWRFDSGFTVRGGDTRDFLWEKLSILGLSGSEAAEFIEFWAPEMEKNKYNLITFSTDQYEMLAPLTITPRPDSVLRVHMVYRPVNSPVSIPEQKLRTFKRVGFTVVEWGGTRAFVN